MCLVTVEYFIVYKSCQHRVNASCNSATVTFSTVFKMCRYCVNVVLGPVSTYPEILKMHLMKIDLRQHEKRFRKYPRPHENALAVRNSRTDKLSSADPQTSKRML